MGQERLQGFWILLAATLIVSVVQFFTAEEPVSSPDNSQLDEITLSEDSLSVQSLAVVVGDSLLEGAESWEYLPAEQSRVDAFNSPLTHFFTALNQLEGKRKKVRIAYFGDSLIEGDLITQSLRNELQEIFGGQGVGFVPITSKTYGFRKSIRHRFSPTWQTYNLLGRKPSTVDFGISGELFMPASSRKAKNWVRYQGSSLYNRTQKFSSARLFYGKDGDQGSSDVGYMLVETQNGNDTLFLRGSELVNKEILPALPSEEVDISFNLPTSLPFYGVSFESDSGLHLDNFSTRGHSGMNLINIPQQMLREFDEHMEYDLVVLHFGLNVISTGRRNYDSYERGMLKVIQHFQKALPNTDLLMISVSDKSTKINGVLQTDPSVPLIVEAQRKVAEQTGVGFLDLYRSMGGRNTMIRWVDANLANSDYTHPNRRGARVVGGIIKDYLIEKFQGFQDHLGEQNKQHANK